jgi:GNAT superfamily N-acetyltransferase
LTHFRDLKIRKATWLAEDTISASEIKKYLLTHGLIFHESFGMEMAADLTSVPQDLATPTGLEIIRVADGETLRQWIHVASIGFEVPQEFESVWCDFFEVAVFDPPFQTYLAVLNGKPVGTSQLFASAGVAGIYNVTCVPEARGQGIGAAITQAPLLDAREMGYRVAILQASELGRRVYRRLGFEDYGGLSVYLWENDSSNLSKDHVSPLR